jgi:hypothetical protein
MLTFCFVLVMIVLLTLSPHTWAILLSQVTGTVMFYSKDLGIIVFRMLPYVGFQVYGTFGRIKFLLR